MNVKKDLNRHLFDRKPTLQSSKSNSPKGPAYNLAIKTTFKARYVLKGLDMNKKSPSCQKTIDKVNIRAPSSYFKSKRVSDLNIDIRIDTRSKTPLKPGGASPTTKQGPNNSKLYDKKHGWASVNYKAIPTPITKLNPNDKYVFHPKYLKKYMTSNSKDPHGKEADESIRLLKAALIKKQKKAKVILDVVGAIDTTVLRTIDLRVILAQHLKLVDFCYNLENGSEVVKVLKEYVELIKSDAFFVLDRLCKQDPDCEFNILHSIKLEILGLLSLFYCHVNNIAHNNRKQISQLLLSSSLSFLHLLKLGYTFTGQTAQIRHIEEITNSKTTIGLFSRTKNPLNSLKINNNETQTYIYSLIQLWECENLTLISKNMRTLSLLDAIEAILDSFYELLSLTGPERYPQRQITETPEPSFIIQPYELIYLLPPKTSNKEYTLVIDIHRTIASLEHNTNEIMSRPYASYFLDQVARLYEVIVFTELAEPEANIICEYLNFKPSIANRLYQSSLTKRGNQYIKDLTRLGRDLDKIVILDSNIDGFMFQPENGIFVKPWGFERNDTALKGLFSVLKCIADVAKGDIRQILSEMRTENFINYL